MTSTQLTIKPAVKTSLKGKAAASGDPDQAALDTRNAAAVQALCNYMARHHLANTGDGRKVVARRMGVSETYIFRYLSQDFRGDLAKFETSILAFCEAEELKVEGNQELVGSDFVLKGMRRFLRQVKAHGHIGIGHGPAGRGKTCAARLLAAQDATAIYIHCRVWSCGRHDLTRDLVRLLKLRPAKNETKDEALVRILSGSDRLVIIDNAQRLTESARRWLADFWDATRCPVALIGNPEIEKQWEKNDQHGSRVGLHRDVTEDLKDQSTAKATASHLLRLHLPSAAQDPEILDEAVKTIAAFGSCRAIAMRAKLASTMLAGGKITDVKQAFNLAKTQLITSAAS